MPGDVGKTLLREVDGKSADAAEIASVGDALWLAALDRDDRVAIFSDNGPRVAGQCPVLAKQVAQRVLAKFRKRSTQIDFCRLGEVDREGGPSRCRLFKQWPQVGSRQARRIEERRFGLRAIGQNDGSEQFPNVVHPAIAELHAAIASIADHALEQFELPSGNLHQGVQVEPAEQHPLQVAEFGHQAAPHRRLAAGVVVGGCARDFLDQDVVEHAGLLGHPGDPGLIVVELAPERGGEDDQRPGEVDFRRGDLLALPWVTVMEAALVDQHPLGQHGGKDILHVGMRPVKILEDKQRFGILAHEGSQFARPGGLVERAYADQARRFVVALVAAHCDPVERAARMIELGEAVGSETFSASIRPDKDKGGRLCGLAPGQFPEAQRPADGDERFRLADHGIQRGKIGFSHRSHGRVPTREAWPIIRSRGAGSPSADPGPAPVLGL